MTTTTTTASDYADALTAAGHLVTQSETAATGSVYLTAVDADAVYCRVRISDHPGYGRIDVHGGHSLTPTRWCGATATG